jgi:diguanylate cyclase (GGDEF)-like protein
LEQWVTIQRKVHVGRPVSVVMVDIDHFKAYNDTFGHLAGDDCLRRISGLLVSEARKTGDRVCRFGGEEFIVFLIDIDLPTAILVAERMRREIAARRIPHKAPIGPPFVTASFGIATGALTDDFDLNVLIEGADAALYKASSAGATASSRRCWAWPSPCTPPAKCWRCLPCPLRRSADQQGVRSKGTARDGTEAGAGGHGGP